MIVRAARFAGTDSGVVAPGLWKSTGGAGIGREGGFEVSGDWVCRLIIGDDVAYRDAGNGTSLAFPGPRDGGEEFIHIGCMWGVVDGDVELSWKKSGGQAICKGSEQFIVKFLIAKGRDGVLEVGDGYAVRGFRVALYSLLACATSSQRDSQVGSYFMSSDAIFGNLYSSSSPKIPISMSAFRLASLSRLASHDGLVSSIVGFVVSWSIWSIERSCTLGSVGMLSKDESRE